MLIKVIIAGINGRMGKSCARFLLTDPRFKVVAAAGRANAPYAGSDIGHLLGSPKTDILVSMSVEEALATSGGDVLLDLSLAEAALTNSRMALNKGIRCVIGVSGLQDDQLSELAELSQKANTAVLVVPNFSLGAVLMMHWAKQAAQYFQHCEIVETHHTRKIDAPSGTALHTAKKMAEVRQNYNPSQVTEQELLPGARGALLDSGLRIHSQRLPGLISHQQVMFSNAGELLKIEHSGITGDSFHPGVALALEQVMNINSMKIGLEQVMNLTKS